MTAKEVIQQQITVPAWILAIIVPLLFLMTVKVFDAAKENSAKVATMSAEIKNVSVRLDRIETKLDNHIVQ